MIDFKKELTPRQRQLLRHIARGGTNREFAQVHNLSVKTVEAHRWNLMRVIDCHNMSQCTFYAIKFGYIDVGTSPEPHTIT